VPAAVGVAYIVDLRARLSPRGRWVAVAVLFVVCLPAAALGPGRFSQFGPTLRDARAQVPAVADPLVTGLTAGCWANLAAGLLALGLLAKLRAWLVAVPICISVGALALALQLGPDARPRPQFRTDRFLSAGTLVDRGLRLLDSKEASGCAGATADAATDQVLDRLGCRRLARLLVAADTPPTLVAASVVEMPSSQRARQAFGELFARAAPGPIRPRPIVAGTEQVSREDRYLMVLGAVRTDAGPQAADQRVRLAVSAVQTAVEEDVQGLGAPRGD
jgi:hypothetical protein